MISEKISKYFSQEENFNYIVNNKINSSKYDINKEIKNEILENKEIKFYQKKLTSLSYFEKGIYHKISPNEITIKYKSK